ncbi:hypothetical protein G7051_17605 [Dysgonomonas sp. HDW5B]|uniref:hypothetical protein n=1 Tax=Dysgonomonas sp. HDW5B TaxID=2714927 RepID=UPI00140D27B6|nr:hypothetical protein [Dysgonomonas sp. HDW5B]QIK56077.1 hypothetical protein G7051_17605 [Dysgonomonas sp. HDW5B]
MKKLLLLLPAFFLITSCSSDNDPEDNRAKQYPVNIKLSTIFSESEINSISTYGGSTLYIYQKDHPTIPTGNRGIYVKRDPGETKAFDLACPYEWDKRVQLVLDEYGAFKCSSCGSIYNPNTCKAVEGIAQKSGATMIQYKVEIQEKTIVSKKDVIITN